MEATTEKNEYKLKDFLLDVFAKYKLGNGEGHVRLAGQQTAIQIKNSERGEIWKKKKKDIMHRLILKNQIFRI